MTKYIVIMATMIVLVISQRPPYAGTGNRYPAVLPQYLTREPEQSTVASINNRINNEEDMSSESPTFIDLPKEARGDINLINRIQTWPRENWPFWYLNWRQLEAHRGGSQDQQINYPSFYTERLHKY